MSATAMYAKIAAGGPPPMQARSVLRGGAELSPEPRGRREMFDLSGKVAVITGAGSGIGRGIALSLAQAGADVVASDLLMDRASETAGMVRKFGRKALAQRTDVREPESVQALANATVREFGRLDICVANAGILRLGSVLTLPVEDWRGVVDVNLTGVFVTIQVCGREMVRLGNGGRVIVLSSLAAEVASPGWSAYNATKAAVRHATRSWAFDLAPFGITVNAIGPGWIDTPLIADFQGDGEAREQFRQAIPLGRVGTPEDVGGLAVWLASDEAGYVTGSYNLIDGGLHDGRSAALATAPLRDLATRHQGDGLLVEIDRQAAADREFLRQRRHETGVM
jgi:NAD(P)-dependent dehydrogenase (short-subunit alcohol dehydrogenase family)